MVEQQAAEKAAEKAAESEARERALTQAVDEAIVEGVLDNLKDFVEQAERHRLEMQASSGYCATLLLLNALLQASVLQYCC